MEEHFNMKKVNSPKKIKLTFAYKKPKPVREVTENIDRVRNMMINKELASSRKGGSTFFDYRLDLMKLR